MLSREFRATGWRPTDVAISVLLQLRRNLNNSTCRVLAIDFRITSVTIELMPSEQRANLRYFCVVRPGIWVVMGVNQNSANAFDFQVALDIRLKLMLDSAVVWTGSDS